MDGFIGNTLLAKGTKGPGEVRTYNPTFSSHASNLQLYTLSFACLNMEEGSWQVLSSLFCLRYLE